MAAFYKGLAGEFLQTPNEHVLGTLSTALIRHFPGNHASQLLAWRSQIDALKASLQCAMGWGANISDWGLLFEYPLLRIQKRLDVVLLAGQLVVVIEFKVGAKAYSTADIQQAEDYALDLRDFHEACHSKTILPVLCATNAPKRAWHFSVSAGVQSICLCNSDTLPELLRKIAALPSNEQIDLNDWENSPYKPVPSIIEAAELLYAGHTVREIAHASADDENLGATTDRLIQIVEDAQRSNTHIVAFVTGVPGSGKTLVGLNAIHDNRFRDDDRDAGAYLSGNTPLITVLREALANDEAIRTGKTLRETRHTVKSEIQGLMDYLRQYLDNEKEKPPVDHVIVFDEAQRAWDAEYGAQKFERSKSEPALFLEIMDRHPDWAVIIALVGGGQEINRGERGLSEWGTALMARNKEFFEPKWSVVAAPDALTQELGNSWQSIFGLSPIPAWAEQDDRLHLKTSVRSYKCMTTANWVNAFLSGDFERAKDFTTEIDQIPIFLTRSLDNARRWLRDNARGSRRCGLISSSGGRRLRAEGLGVSLSATQLPEVANWYLKPKGDIRSSYALEVTANEYTCQGLELDFVGVCWDGDLIFDRTKNAWTPRKLSGSKWQISQSEDAQRWIINKYRVILTRARLGSVIWVPLGDASDDTRLPDTYDSVVEKLRDSGIQEI